MKIIDRAEVEKWCKANSCALDGNGLPFPPMVTESFKIPQDTGKRIAMVKDHLTVFQSKPEILVWFTEWGVWPSGERAHIFERFRISYGEKRNLIDSPGHLFSSTEHEDVVSFVTLGVLFLWNVFVFSSKYEKFLFYSHDEVGGRIG